MTDISVKIDNLFLKNPIMPASGCFGYGREFSELYSLSELGAIVVKSISPNPKKGNETPRIAETPSGMLNAIGLQNPGIEHVDKELSFLKKFNTPVICNVAADTFDGYLKVASALDKRDDVHALEINISCPNVACGGMSFGTDPDLVYNLTKSIVDICNKPVIMKLTPNVTDIVSIAKAAEEGGANALSLINTLLGMKIDINTGKPLLANKTGGLSGPAIRPVAIRMVYQVYDAVDIPIIGMGGVSSVDDVIEMAYAGASAVAIGAYQFVDPYICINIIEELPKRILELGHKSWTDLVGYAHR
ncbi:MAG: dihydroorotate dehydrogenase [Tissierellia bacterium]|nr:dihydroorotate dehydrogenase [Tissierellia bacterium]